MDAQTTSITTDFFMNLNSAIEFFNVIMFTHEYLNRDSKGLK